MPRYQSDEPTTGTFLDFHENFQKGNKKEYKHYLKTSESKIDLTDASHHRSEFISPFPKAREDSISRSDAGDTILPREEKQFPWIKEGFDELKSMEIGSSSFGQGDDHFHQVLNAKAPNTQETSDLLDQVVELRAELEGRIRDLSDFKDEIKELGKLLKADPSRQSQ